MPLFHPLLHESLFRAGFWPSRTTIQTVTSTTSVAGQLIPTGGTNIAGMVAIPSRISALSMRLPFDKEKRDPQVIEEESKRILKLNGYFPQIQPRTMRAICDGIPYIITGVESDSEHFSTRLNVEDLLPRTIV